jgi:RHS repeat-associated protein
MVALNEKFSHSGNLVSGGQLSPDVIDGFGFTKRSEEVRGGSVAIFGVAGFRELSDASPLRRFAAPLNQSDPETELYYVRNRMYNPALGRWIQRDPIGTDSRGLLPPGWDSGDVWGWSKMQRLQQQEHEMEMRRLRTCAADAAKLAVTVGSLMWDINEALESGGASVPFGGAGMAYAVNEANQEIQQLVKDGCEPGYRGLVTEADSLIGWAKSLLPPPSHRPPSFNTWPPPT